PTSLAPSSRPFLAIFRPFSSSSPFPSVYCPRYRSCRQRNSARANPGNEEDEMAAPKKSGGKSSQAKPKAKRGTQGGLARPVTPDAALGAVIGTGSVTRAELTKKVWDYVKKNNLQDPKDKRTIRADDKLRPVFGGKDKVSMFEMTKLVNQHVGPA